MSLTALELILIAGVAVIPIPVYVIFSAVKSDKPAKQAGPDVDETMVRENAKIVGDYAKYIENSGGGILFDVACLPHPKQAITEALILQLYEPHGYRFESLGAMLIRLADFQEGVGPEPLFATGVDPRRGFDMSDIKAFAKQVATYPHRERYKQFEALQKKDQAAFLEMIAKVKKERAKGGLSPIT